MTQQFKQITYKSNHHSKMSWSAKWATTQIDGAPKPVGEFEINCPTTAASGQVVIDARGAAGLHRGANTPDERHATDDIVTPSRSVMIFASQARAPQINAGPRSHSDKRPYNGRAAVRAISQNDVERAGVAAGCAGRKGPTLSGQLRVREPSLRRAGERVRDAVRQRAVGCVAGGGLNGTGQAEAGVRALRDGYGRKAALHRQEAQVPARIGR